MAFHSLSMKNQVQQFNPFALSLTSANMEAQFNDNDVEMMAEDQGNNPFALCAMNSNPFKFGNEQNFLSDLISQKKEVIKDANGFKVLQKKFL